MFASLLLCPAQLRPPGHTRRNWLAVASANHVRRGRAEGFMQICHGKVGPLRRIRPGDRVVYYSPTETFGGGGALQAFTAVGIVADGEPYPHDMGGGFVPYRRDVRWLDAHDAPIRPLLDRLEFTAGIRNWGYKLRFGVLELSAHDMTLVSEAMGVFSPARPEAGNGMRMI
jgi:hypothetical protein